jgi:hypothetical protein
MRKRITSKYIKQNDEVLTGIRGKLNFGNVCDYSG